MLKQEYEMNSMNIFRKTKIVCVPRTRFSISSYHFQIASINDLNRELLRSFDEDTLIRARAK